MKLVLDIPWPTPSLNDFAHKGSRWAYRTTKTRWLRRITDAWLDVRATAGRRDIWPTPPVLKVRVTIERYGRTANALDADNFLGGLKPVLDALRELRLIADDRALAIDLVGAQLKNPYRAPPMWTRITLEQLLALEAD